MAYNAEYVCPDTAKLHAGDPLNCPDRLIILDGYGTYGLLIHDGGSSSVEIGLLSVVRSGIAVRQSLGLG